jgi:hypothetical protein
MLKTPKLTREQWLNAFTDRARPQFKKAGVPLPKKVRCSIGFPSAGSRSLVIGECWQIDATDDKVHEIFIRPSLQSDSARVADVLTHELCHAALPAGTKHGKEFKALATALGLTGKMRATVAGPEWHKWADPILKELGPLPGAKLGERETLKGGKKKQTTRMLKLTCDECGWSCRTTKQHIEGLGELLTCPCSATGCEGHLLQS